MPKASILIAEDDPVLREAYVRKFTREGFEIRVAEDGEDAAEMIREHPPELLICDVRMPRRDGWWVLEQFPKGRRPFPAIMLTNLEDEDTRRRCELLADGYLVKRNMELATLIQMIERLLPGRSER